MRLEDHDFPLFERIGFSPAEQGKQNRSTIQLSSRRTPAMCRQCQAKNSKEELQTVSQFFVLLLCFDACVLNVYLASKRVSEPASNRASKQPSKRAS